MISNSILHKHLAGTPPICLVGQVAIVTGAGGGLGRAHALELARRGARVVVNDLGVRRDGQVPHSSAAESVVEEIRSMGGEAIASIASVTDANEVQGMVDATMARWGRIDILVNMQASCGTRTFPI